ncbi:hypothetical protein [Streptomyces filamentosus]|uniref:hypothetical protein n=1 Tax=Streptomyces filamentosus TaxID=67294 RepID=UPI001238680C|nr:hypothetical protein [Streptomyces filamentosus]KAA6216435.1 hypothetical protein CP979_05350 [Streptomyces filamentosus]
MTQPSPADELRTAATALRTAADALPTEYWGNRPWHAEECNDTDDMASCPCIVAQGEYRDYDQRQDPPVQYVADAETPEHAAYIALMHPGVGHALADLLEAVGDDPDDETLQDPGSDRHDHCDRTMCAPAAALAVARALIGSQP